MSHHSITAGTALLLLIAANAGYAQGGTANPDHKVLMCQGCHGIPGYRTAFPAVYNVPKLGGQHPGYIVKALQGYKSGERSHPTMRAIAADLSDADMTAISTYYGSAEAKSGAAK